MIFIIWFDGLEFYLECYFDYCLSLYDWNCL